MSKKIGSFKLCGLDYIIRENTEMCLKANRKWLIDTPRGIVDVALKSETGKNLNKEVVIDYVFDAILYIIIALTMEKRSLYEKDEIVGYAHTIIQGLKTLKWSNEKGLGSVVIMNTTYDIKVNNKLAHDEEFLGRYDDRNLEILLTNEHPSGLKHNEKFTISTILHEIIHGVNYKMGYGSDKRNKESFVNTLSSFLTEVYFSLKILNVNYSKNYKVNNLYDETDLINNFE